MAVTTRKKATIKDIAREAGVSAATVSYVLNNVPGKTISAPTRANVLAAVEKLQYVPSFAAQQMRRQQSACIVVRMANAVMLPRHIAMLQGIRAYFEPLGWTVLLCNDTVDRRACLDLCLNGRADGILFVPVNEADGEGSEEIAEDLQEEILRRDIPLVMIDAMAKDPAISCVSFNYFNSSFDRVQYLYEKGVRHFVYIRPSFRNYKEDMREQGMRAGVSQHPDATAEIRVIEQLSEPMLSDRGYIWDSDSILRTWRTRGREILLDPLPVDAGVVCAHEGMQTGMASLLCEEEVLHGRRGALPWKIRSVSYRFPHYEAGLECARILHSRIRGDGTVRRFSMEPALQHFTETDFFPQAALGAAQVAGG